MAKRAQPPNQHSTTWRRLSPYTARAVDQYEAILFPHALRFTGNSSSDYRALIRARFGGSFKNTFACKFLFAAKSECESLILPHEKNSNRRLVKHPIQTTRSACSLRELRHTQQDGYRISTGAAVWLTPQLRLVGYYHGNRVFCVVSRRIGALLCTVDSSSWRTFSNFFSRIPPISQFHKFIIMSRTRLNVESIARYVWKHFTIGFVSLLNYR